MTASEAAETHLYTKLLNVAGMAALVSDRVYFGVIPQKSPFPCVVIQSGGGPDLHDLGEVRQGTELVYTVKSVDKGQSSREDINALIDTALHLVSSSQGGLSVNSYRRGQIPSYFETTKGVTYSHVGGRYNVLVR